MPEEFNDAEPLLRVSRGLSIRPLLHSDAAVVARYGNNIKITRNMTNRFPFPYSLDDAHGFIAHVRDRKTWRPLHTPSKPEAIPAESIRQVLDGRLAPVHWAIALNGKYIGNMGFEFGSDVEEHTAKLGYWIAEEHWGHG
jgi:[ribosomal protein S5]-alanine N-acetyltransferase